MQISNAEYNMLKAKVEKLEKDRADLLEWLEREKDYAHADYNIDASEAFKETIKFINKQDK